MPTELIYPKDSYLLEFGAVVKSVNGKDVVLDRTAFYPEGGGQLCDNGSIKRQSDGKEFKIVFVKKFEGEISHEVDSEGLRTGDAVYCNVDWKRRSKSMRSHTATHIMSRIIFNKTGALINGNQLGLERTRIDFTLDTFDRSILEPLQQEANTIVQKELPVKIHFIPKADAEKEQDLARLEGGVLPDLPEIRVVEIEGFDRQACGGTHVANTVEIGYIKILSAENKGKKHRRVYFEVA